MAYNLVESLGHTQPVVGGVYSRWSMRYSYPGFEHKLKSFNTTTGMGTFTDGSFVRLSDLSHWHLLRIDEQ